MAYNNKGKKPYKKYNNVEKYVDGIKFDSLTEADFYEYLKEEKRRKRVIHFDINKTYVLLAGYSLDTFEIEGQTVKRRKASDVKYIADFVVLYANGQSAIIDTKGGVTTEAFKLKKKMFEQQHGLPIVEARKKDGKWVYS